MAISRFRSRMALIASLIIPVATSLQAEDWPTFRGPERTGVAPDDNLLEAWPEEGPKLIWEAAGAGRGYSSVIIAGDQLFTLGDGCSTASDADEYLTAYDLKSGKQLWAAKTGTAWNEGPADWQSSRSTPTVDEGMVYVITPQGSLVCCEANSGNEVWRKQLKDDFGGNKGDGWGYSESVLIDGDRLICTPGGETSTVVALDKKTGELIWKCVREGDRGAGHSSVVMSNVGGNPVYVQVTASGPMGISPADGKLLWTYDIEKTTAVIPTPIIRGDLVFFAVGYGRGGALLKQVPGAKGAVTVEEVYPLNTKLANKHGGVILIGDHLYGDSDDKALPFCADLMTGEERWKSRASGKGSAAFTGGDGMLYIQFANGVFVLAKATPEGYEEVSKFTIPGDTSRPCWAHPVINDGKLYIRVDDRLLCYDITAK
jgi:outer membrane protein assembly factor BamB